MVYYTCKNCGRKYSSGGTVFGMFCCKGCKLDYEHKKAGIYNSENNSSGNGKGGATFGTYLLLAIIVIVVIIIKANH